MYRVYQRLSFTSVLWDTIRALTEVLCTDQRKSVLLLALFNMKAETNGISEGEYFLKNRNNVTPHSKQITTRTILVVWTVPNTRNDTISMHRKQRKGKGLAISLGHRHKFYNFKDCGKVVKGMNKNKEKRVVITIFIRRR